MPTKRSADDRRGGGRGSIERNMRTLRESVAQIDGEILDLVAKRLLLARRIGRVKRDHGLPVQDFQIERQVVERNRSRAERLGLASPLVDEVTRLLIEHATRVQDADRRLLVQEPSAAGERILVVGGLGGMGRWLARFFSSLGHSVTVLDRPGVRTRTEFPRAQDLARAAVEHSVVALATPIAATAPILDRIVRTGTSALIFDVCSLKQPVRRSIDSALAKGLRVASIHPMFGPDADVLAGRNVLLCRTQGTDHSIVAGRFFEQTTAALVSIPIERHDELMSYVLGLSHLTSLVFARALATSGLSYETLSAAGSTTFASQTRVSRSVSAENQDLYFEIQTESTATPILLRSFSSALEAFATAIRRKDRRRFKSLMDSTRAYFELGSSIRGRSRSKRPARPSGGRDA